METVTIQAGEVRAVLLADGWHECASINYADGLLSSTFEIASIWVDNGDNERAVDHHRLTPGFRFRDADGADIVGPTTAILSMKLMDEGSYLQYAQQREAK